MKMKKRLRKNIRFKRSRIGQVIRRNVFKISVWSLSYHGKYWIGGIRNRYYLAKSRN